MTTKVNNRMIDGAPVNVVDFGAVADGVTDSTAAFEAAIETKRNVFIPEGTYVIVRSLKPYPGQRIEGEGVPQRAQYINPPATRILQQGEAHGIDTSFNNAHGFTVKRLAIVFQGTTVDKIGVKIGISGSTDGTSQAIKFNVEDVLAIGPWSRGFGVYDWAWSGTFYRCSADRYLNRGFDIRRAGNVVSLYSCEAILGSQFHDGKGLVVDGAFSVNAESFRSENNRVAAEIVNGATVHMDCAYFEGNRVFDVIVKDPFTQFTSTNMSVFHANDNVTTAAIVSAQNTDFSTNIIIDGMFLRVTDGKVGEDNKLTAFYDGQAVCNTVIRNVAWSAKATTMSPLYDPTELTFSQLPFTKFFMRSRTLPTVLIGETRTSVVGPPADDTLFTLTNYDGSTTVVGLENGSRYNHYDTGTVDYRYYSGGAWVAVNR